MQHRTPTTTACRLTYAAARDHEPETHGHGQALRGLGGAGERGGGEEHGGAWVGGGGGGEAESEKLG